MRSSRSHTGPRPLSDFTYIDEDPSNFMYVKTNKHHADQEHDSSSRGSRITSINSPASPLLLNVPSSGSSNNSNHRHTNNNRNSSNYTTNKNLDTGTPNSPSSGSSDPILPSELPKIVHETSI